MGVSASIPASPETADHETEQISEEENVSTEDKRMAELTKVEPAKDKVVEEPTKVPLEKAPLEKAPETETSLEKAPLEKAPETETSLEKAPETSLEKAPETSLEKAPLEKAPLEKASETLAETVGPTTKDVATKKKGGGNIPCTLCGCTKDHADTKNKKTRRKRHTLG